MKEAYCSYEVSKLLKEKGFDERSSASYDSKGELQEGYGYWNKTPIWYAAPTHQMACAWLREKGFEVIVIPVWQTLSKVYRSYVLSDLGNKYKDFPDSYSDNISYEEAVEAALKYSLENLI